MGCEAPARLLPRSDVAVVGDQGASALLRIRVRAGIGVRRRVSDPGVRVSALTRTKVNASRLVRDLATFRLGAWSPAGLRRQVGAGGEYQSASLRMAVAHEVRRAGRRRRAAKQVVLHTAALAIELGSRDLVTARWTRACRERTFGGAARHEDYPDTEDQNQSPHGQFHPYASKKL